ncbi:Peptidoglycan deacetylase [Urbifossiella limnaea]|uniref:Peptidoglycan deacetylase n=2 Tax=Urbifossiella limnaea TaxID=2528023 RepID=A0A517XRA7_9BACT|nr:Peptidoglycan deacetylase [Urbifossiella limnaea]
MAIQTLAEPYLAQVPTPTPTPTTSYVVSFDVEEHNRIEAASGLNVSPQRQREYSTRMASVTLRLLDQLAAAGVQATFYVVGDIAITRPELVRAIHAAGHEIGSHSWDHSRVHRFDPKSFRTDLLRSKDALEQVTGERVYGFRAPTFSVDRKTAWAVDVLAECGFEYDSSIFPIRHDRYGIPDAPQTPFVAVGRERELLELPPLTYRVLGMNLPVAGGGYFRLFPPAVMRAGLRQATGLAMLYFHPWEFDADQPRLPLGFLSRWRTYVGVRRTTERLTHLLAGYPFRRAIDAVREMQTETLPRFSVSDDVQAV